MCKSIPAAIIHSPHPPGRPWAFEKIGKMPGPAGNFHWQIPHPQFLLWWSKAQPPRPSDLNIYKTISCQFLINITVLAQWNCNNEVIKWDTPTKDKANVFTCIALLGVLWSLNDHITKLRCLKLLTSELPSEMMTMLRSNILLFANGQGPGHY